MYCDPNIAELGKSTQFKPGNTLGGRTHGAKSFSKCLERAMDLVAKNMDPLSKQVEEKEMRDWIAVALTAKAASGDVAAIKEALDRMEGKATQRMELTGKDGEPLEINHGVRLQDAWSALENSFTLPPTDTIPTLPSE